jgi:hypothetical protein
MLRSRFSHIFFLALICVGTIRSARAQGARQSIPNTPVADSDADHVKERNAWFYRGRIVPGKPSAELRRRAYETKMQMRQRAALVGATTQPNVATLTPSGSSPGIWTPLGPAPLASDASGNGTQDYHQVSGRATAVAIDPADPSGNTVYIGGAQGGVWKSTNGAATSAASVSWTPVTDNQATLSVGAIAIQPGNVNPAASVILVATGEANNSADSYFGLGILRSADAGNTWNLISSANSGALSLSGLGGTRMAFSTASTVVAAMATSSEGLVDGAVTTSTTRGLYTSLDAGQTWTYNALLDPGSQATDATSAASVVYNASAGLFFAAIRYHGFYSSLDGVTWTRLASQPGGSALSTTACPPLSTSNTQACPIYRGEITVVPGRNEMYAWYISLDSGGDPVDQGIWQSTNGGASWTQINDSGITNCSDSLGCGVAQGSYNLELLAVPNGTAATDLYAGAINLYKCSINSSNPTCNTAGFMNLTHVYGCDPIAAPAHVHPDQHALAYMIPTTGSDSGSALLYFANDGGIYRALDGFTGLSTGSCSGTNQFDDLNQNLGSMTQFVSFSQHPTDPNTLLGGTQDNGSPATASATTSTNWINVNGGDGGFNAIDPIITANWFVSNPDIPPGGLNVLECGSGVNCHSGNFSSVVGSSGLGGDDGAFYFPYILDPQSSTAVLVGTCRVWRGPRLGGTYTVLSPNFDTLAAGTCTGSEVNLVRSLAAGGLTDSNGSLVIYATTDGLGPLDGPATSPAGGNVWVTTNATAGTRAFTRVTQSINPNQFPISSVAIDSSDATGNTAYVTVMGFTGGPGHVWKTTNAGASWSDFTGSGNSALPDAPANAVIVDSSSGTVYVGTDVGVFQSSTSSAAWTEVGPNPASGANGFLPNVAVTGLGLFNSGGQKLLRASTYGRGVWQMNPNAVASFELAVSNSPQIVFSGQTATFDGTATALNGYSSSVTLSCVAGTTGAPSVCTPTPSTLTPANNTPFSVSAGGAVGDYSFNLLATGSDSNQTQQQAGLVLHVVNWGLTAPSPSSVTVPRGTTSSPVSFQVTAAGSFNQSVTVSCSVNIASATCNLAPGTTVTPTASTPVNMTASVNVPANAAPGSYIVTIVANTSGSAQLTTTFTLTVTTNPDFVLQPVTFPSVNAGNSNASAPLTITSQDGFSGTVNLTCSTASGSCSISPTSVSSFPTTATLTVNASSLAAGSYQLSVQGTSGSTTHTLNVPFNVGDYRVSGPSSLTLAPGAQGSSNLTITPSTFYNSQINASCDASALPGATCTLSPQDPVTVNSGSTTTLTVTLNLPNNAALGNYTINIHTADISGTPSHSVTITVTVAQDFTVVSSTTIQTVTAGQTTGPYNLTIAPVGTSFTNAVTLSCSNLPPLTQCLFNPSAPITPGSSSVSVVMTISTTGTTASLQPAAKPGMTFYALWLALPGIMIVWSVPGAAAQHQRRAISWIAALLLLVAVLASCGGASTGGSGGGGGHPGTPAGNYTITVTGSAGSVSHSVTVGLTVQ